ncbi:hypothetical protein BATDEDRAFT_28426 [Batrachochytrium dendrobatidis JAM81]|uniref:PIG-P domain-containing protein n=2 Tax=Batrachochytrium dendrobatidis TaxID=109871 RepID=F4PE32_BATDJ|nr:uncharacterized protein BATDEDRAFT_28426 [Batrachochytrium dendrobatidis JAM81]EGF76482.1 hypothetical protein BATDEDRAFT_28426 [Batrachochytrium dendrobatidis JAM81]KAJ8331915.1 hypothetical protein O5D80_000212 [Batrachochytrium dendrobatidis]KAK5672651.1 hypothetical protein QVD99_000168 [Batrachochytrium dendrobatidis]OAJ39203.1 hypothetical protein BDEG_23067 [Batrachochytrium dendrobatidis JEL423]|eukprot:XP_006682813.1 hypothetical protein BATDEDRAFT_28426 [Batrachochytrium dendrobatidis JAM81]
MNKTQSKNSFQGGIDPSVRTPSTTREYYGFVLYLSSFVSFALYILWSVLPDRALHSIGITYYPSRNWALTIPLWILGLIPFTLVVFTATNLLNTPPFQSFMTLTDKHARTMALTSDGLNRVLKPELIPALEDVPIALVNRCWSHENRLFESGFDDFNFPIE